MKCVKGKIEISLFDLLEDIDRADIMELVDAVSVQDDVIRFVAQQILDGWTEMESHAARGCEAEPRNALDRAVREVAKRSGDVAKKEIEELERVLKMETDRNKKLSQEIAECGHKWGTHGFARDPPCPGAGGVR